VLWVLLLLAMVLVIGLLFGGIWLATKFASALWSREGCAVCGETPLFARDAWSHCDQCHAHFCQKCGRPTRLVCTECGGPIVRWDPTP
jgi:hypothetical protein